MGILHIPIEITGDRTAKVQALVDTGAALTVIPADLAEKLGIMGRHAYRAMLADGRVRVMKAGTADIKVKGRNAPATVLISPRGSAVLLGAETLELLEFSVDLKHGRLRAKWPTYSLMAARSTASRETRRRHR